MRFSTQPLMITDLYNTFMKLSRDTLHEVVRNYLWVPKQLTLDHLEKHMAASLEFLTRYHLEGDDFLDKIITYNET